MSKLDEFKDYVRGHSRLKDEVLTNKMSWQTIFETWSLSSDDPFKQYRNEAPEAPIKEEPKQEASKEDSESTEDMVKNILGYLKKVNPDNVTKYVTSIQKVLELLGSFGAGATASAAVKKNTTDPLFDRRYDDWY